MNEVTDFEASLSDVFERIRGNRSSSSCDFWRDVEGRAAKILVDAQAVDDSSAANKAWFLNKIASACALYVQCFDLLRSGEYYKAWCDLEQIEIGLIDLQKNDFYDLAQLDVRIFAETIDNWQKLFPYHVFASPEFLHKEVKCSICNNIIRPLSMCDHHVGRVYCGRQCHHIVTKVELLGVSIVKEPVQKYSVLSADIDNMDYSAVKFVVDRLRSPFDGWSIKWTEAYHPHELFKGRKPESGCPCRSGRTYQDCCLMKPGVVRPHLDVLFEHDPPASLPTGQLSGYGLANQPAGVSVDGAKLSLKPKQRRKRK